MPKTIRDEDEFLRIARERKALAESREKDIRAAASRDLRFLSGDQWDEADKAARNIPGQLRRPALTINKLPPFVDQVTNEQRKNRPGVKVSPQGGGADPDTAEILQGIIRHIEYISQADVAYDTAFDYAVSSSFGYWRYVTEYVDDRSADQEIKVARIKDPFSVLFDPAAEEVDYSDAKWAFLCRNMTREEFKRTYPKSDTAQRNFGTIGGTDANEWLNDDGSCVVAEYWQIDTEKKQLWIYRGIPAPAAAVAAASAAPVRAPAAVPATGAPLRGAPSAPGAPGVPAIAPPPGVPGLPPGLPPGLFPAPVNRAPMPMAPPPAAPRAFDADEEGLVTRGFFEDEEVPEGFEPDLDDDGEPIGREVEVRTVWRIDINGNELLTKPRLWAGKYIPIVPCLGKEKFIDGKRQLYSAVRFALDSQQLYNFYKTTEAEVIQMTPKNPYIGYLGQFKTQGNEWSNMNVIPYPYLEVDPVTVGGQPAPLPQRQPYEPATAALNIGAAAANEDIKATTGLFDASRGRGDANATSGIAISRLQQQGETATYHFFDNFLRSMWHGYRIVLDLIPKIYDTPRVVRIVRPDDQGELVQINRMFTRPEDGKQVKYDLSGGLYAVALSVQPAAATRRQQAAADLGQLAQADPAQLPLWSDLFVKTLDIGPIGEEIADRLTPPQYRKQDEMNPQQMQAAAAQMMQQNQQLTEQVHMLAQQLEQKQAEQQAKLVMDERDTQAKLLMDQRDNATRMAIVTMQEETKRMIEAHKVTVARITSRERMAHDLGLRAHDRAHDALAASQFPAAEPDFSTDEPEGLPGDDTGADIDVPTAGAAVNSAAPAAGQGTQPGAQFDAPRVSDDDPDIAALAQSLLAPSGRAEGLQQ